MPVVEEEHGEDDELEEDGPEQPGDRGGGLPGVEDGQQGADTGQGLGEAQADDFEKCPVVLVGLGVFHVLEDLLEQKGNLPGGRNVIFLHTVGHDGLGDGRCDGADRRGGFGGGIPVGIRYGFRGFGRGAGLGGWGRGGLIVG